MDEVAALEAERGTSVPVAMANWPTVDPLEHPDEPLATEDLVGVDANHVLPTSAWPGGTFASFHAYPYYPDFQRYEKGLQDEEWGGQGRVRRLPDGAEGPLRRHMPLLVTEFGVPSSLGSAHYGTNGRDQGNHTEQDAMAMDADMMRMMQDKGIGAAFVFAWTDEWFKRTWNTEEHQDAERRQLWHDPLTNEQWFGLVATDSEPVADAAVELTPETGDYEYLYAWADASYVHLEVTMREALPDRLVVDADVAARSGRGRLPRQRGRRRGHRAPRRTPGARPDAAGHRVRPYHPDEAEDWHLYRLITNREFARGGTTTPAEYLDVGELVQGDWDPQSDDYDSLATWQVDEPGRTVRLRIPWSMLGLADPSSHLALGEGKPAERVTVDGIGFALDADGATEQLDFRWPDWNNTGYQERRRPGSTCSPTPTAISPPDPEVASFGRVSILDDAREGMNPDIRPQDDLFGHVNGRWLDTAEIPSDRSSWGPFVGLADIAEQQVHAIIEELAAAAPRRPGRHRRRQDRRALRVVHGHRTRSAAQGTRPIRPVLDALDGLRDVRDLAAFLGEVERVGGYGLFGSYVNTDARNSDRYLFHLVQGGLGLPDESYYREDQFAEIRGEVRRLPDPAARAGRRRRRRGRPRGRRTVLEMDTRLAAGHWERTETRDVQKTYNLSTAEELRDARPGLRLGRLRPQPRRLSEETIAEVVVGSRPTSSTSRRCSRSSTSRTGSAWLLTRVLRSAAPYLTDDFVEANFDFYGRTLNGTPELRARWKRGVALVEGAIGEAVGKQYVARHFPPASKALMDELVAQPAGGVPRTRSPTWTG